MPRSAPVAAAALAALAQAPATLASVSVIQLNVPVLNSLSADGRTLFGYEQSFDAPNAFVFWTQPAGLRRVTLPTDIRIHSALLSGDGSAVVGALSSPEHFKVPYRWSAADGLQLLASTWATPTGVSFDSSVIVGSSSFLNAFLWTSAGGAQTLDTSFAITHGSNWRVSADGSIFAGSATGWPTPVQDRPVLITPHGHRFIDSDLFTTSTFTTHLSADGTALIARDLDYRIFHVSDATGVREITTHFDPNDEPSRPLNISYDGARVLLSHGSQITGASRYWIWTTAEGLIPLDTFLDTALGPAYSGWTWHHAYAMSDDGNTFTVAASAPDQAAAFYIVHIPAPAAGALFTFAFTLTAARRRR